MRYPNKGLIIDDSKFRSATNGLFNKYASQGANAINRSLTAIRREFVEDQITRTGLKRKILNDRMPLVRASRDKLEGDVALIFGKRIYMSDYPTETVLNRQRREVIRLTSPLYRKNTRTAFWSKDHTRIYIRTDSGYVRGMRGRSVPNLFNNTDLRRKYDMIARDIFDREVGKIFVSVRL